MPCVHPRLIPNPVFRKLRYSNGDPVPSFAARDMYLTVPCGRCFSCLSMRQNTWSWRIENDAIDCLNNGGAVYFITFTYDDNHLVYGKDDIPTLYKKDLQDFHKRVRASGLNFRFYDCGEYGDRFSRPHYHGIYFFDSWLSAEYVHDIFFSHWKKCEDFELRVDSFSLASAKYVAKYAMKRFGINYDGVQPPFSMMSLKPTIGSSFLKNEQEIRRLKNTHSLTVYDSSGNSYCLPRYFRDRIFDKYELRNIYERLSSDNRVYLSMMYDDSVERSEFLIQRGREFAEQYKVFDNFYKNYGKDCNMNYSSYISSV